jgi:thiamine-phosphate pyrophosphorylase
MLLVMPRLYVILDAGLMTGSPDKTAKQLIEAGVRMLQYRSKTGSARQTLEISRQLAEIARKNDAVFFVNDRPDIARLSGAAGVHVGQTDLSVQDARIVIGVDRWIGVSTHNEEQFHRATNTAADYIAVGPIYATNSKENCEPVVGTEFIRRVRGLTAKPIVAIGGITLGRAAEVIAAGADSVAVIRDILKAEDPGTRARQFLEELQTYGSAR